MSYNICQKPWNVQLRVNSGIKYGLRVMMFYKFRSTNRNKCRSLVENFDHGDHACVGAGSIWNISTPSSPFFCEHKSARKIIYWESTHSQ